MLGIQLLSNEVLENLVGWLFWERLKAHVALYLAIQNHQMMSDFLPSFYLHNEVMQYV